jgi:TonB-linked SusC/RagA family outer membrane protein
MKKTYDLRVHSHPWLKKLLIELKIAFLIMIVSVSNLLATPSYSQTAKVSLNGDSKSLEQVMDEIELQSEFYFIFNQKQIDVNRIVDVQVNDKLITDVLPELFRGTDVSYAVFDRKILLTTEPIGSLESGETNVELQQTEVTGTITDSSTGEPMPGVNVTVKGTTVGLLTDISGKYAITAPEPNSVIVFSFIGYNSQEISIAGQRVINVKLVQSIEALDEVVVIGYGTQKKVNLTGSISTLDIEKLNDRPITNVSQAVQGLSGLYVNQAGAEPGADEATIRIRGIGTIGGASKLDPLVIVDGVEFSLSGVNPNDIESISVLKDAASTSIYGSRAANGVILITTKKGRTGKSLIEYSNYFGFQEATYLPDPVDNSVDFLEAYNTAMVNGSRPKYYSDALIDEFRNNPTSDIYPNTNWMDLMFSRGFIQDHNFRISGGTEIIKYNLSIGYLNQNGILMGTSSEKYSTNLRISAQLNKRLNIEGSVIGSFRDNVQNVGGISTAMNRLMRMVPIQPSGRFEDGRWPDSWVLTPGQNSFTNPLIRATEGFRNQKTNNILGSLSLKFNILEGLDYQMKAAVNRNDGLLEEFDPWIKLYDPRTGEYTRGYSSRTRRFSSYESSPRLTIYNTLNYQKQLGDNHSIIALAGYSFERRKSMDFDARVDGLPSNDLTELDLGTVNPTVGGTSSISVLSSYFGRLQYSFMDRYLLESNFRYDGSSRFHPDNRWGFFPSFSLGWRIGQENFMQNMTWLDELKIRSSWGQIGNQEIGMFQYVNAVALGTDYAFGGVIAPGAAVTQSKDPNVSWETTTVSNLGLDWSLFRGKFSGVAEIFRKRTDGILRSVTLPAQVGDLSGPTSNIAVVDNTGFEITMNYQNQISKDISYEIGGNLTRVKNNVVDTKGEIIYSGNTITQEGSPINSWFAYETDGLFQNAEEVASYPTVSSQVGPGDIKYVDRDKNGKIDGGDRYIAGNSFPDYTYSFNVGLTIKGVQLTTFWQGVVNIKVYPDYNTASPFYNGAGLQKKWLTDAWTPENTNAPLPRLTSRNLYPENFYVSDFWLRDASYLRLKNIQISYPIPVGILNKVGIQQLKIFVNAQNLLTFSKFTEFDPERNITQTNLSEYPSVKIFTIGLNVNL